jgi:hypothetical protein
MRLYNYFFHNDLLPKWLLLLNKISLFGILAWPLVLFASLFMFDNPNVNMRKMTIYCILLNCYPLALILLSFLSYKLYSINPILAAVFPAIPVLLYLCIVILVMFFA